MIKGYFIDSPDERLVTTQLYMEFLTPRKIAIKTQSYNRDNKESYSRQFALFMKKYVRFHFIFEFNSSLNDWIVIDINVYYPTTDSKMLTPKQEEKLIDLLKPLIAIEMKKPSSILLAMEGELTSKETSKENRKKDMDHYEKEFKNSVTQYTDACFKCTLLEIQINEFKKQNNL